jgi:hypothetical protein
MKHSLKHVVAPAGAMVLIALGLAGGIPAAHALTIDVTSTSVDAGSPNAPYPYGVAGTTSASFSYASGTFTAAAVSSLTIRVAGTSAPARQTSPGRAAYLQMQTPLSALVSATLPPAISLRS